MKSNKCNFKTKVAVLLLNILQIGKKKNWVVGKRQTKDLMFLYFVDPPLVILKLTVQMLLCFHPEASRVIQLEACP